MSQLDKTSCAVFKVIPTGYGFWNLDYFCYLIPPFCVSQDLKNIRMPALQYLGAFYPLPVLFTSNILRVDATVQYLSEEHLPFAILLPYLEGRYIALPHKISELNNVFCTPLNRRGLLCRDCIDGFGPSLALDMLEQTAERATTGGYFTSYQN